MNAGSIVNSDKIFEQMAMSCLETKRWLVGKYSTGDTYETDFTQSIYRYSGKPICHTKFNFTVEGTKCFWCNTFSFLFDDGEIIPDSKIVIESGMFKGKIIVIKRYPKCEGIFGKYKPEKTFFTSNLLSVNELMNRQRMINQSCDSSHKLAISSLINSSVDLPFKSPIFGGWICDHTYTVQIMSENKLMDTVFIDKTMRNTFIQFFILSGTNYISHGSPSYKSLSILNEKSNYKLGNKKIDMDTTLFIEPENYSSFALEYNNRRLYFVGKDCENNINEPNFNIQKILSQCSKISNRLTQNPCMKSYLNMTVQTITPTHEIMNYIRKTGINVFPSFYLFIYSTIFLLNSSFNKIFTESNLYPQFSKIFLDDDLRKYMEVINENLNKELDSDQIIDLLIQSDIRIRLDALQLLGGNIAPLY
uniref:Uncharacterized protein n=1 Tax=viral metagenome TaxID=1070528 RepID=A0A6C0BDW5_9ZZZZ